MKFFLLASIALLICCNIYSHQFPSGNEAKNLTYKTIPSAEKTWGYDIYNNRKLLIHQPSIPAMPGNSGFATKAATTKVAKKVIEKIKAGESPPTISIDEMKALGAIPKS